LTTTHNGIHARLRDNGRWRPPPAHPGNRGRGLEIIRVLGHNVRIDHDESGTTVDFELADTARPSTAAAAADVEQSLAVVGVSAPDTPSQLLRLTGDLDLETAGTIRPALLAAVGAVDDRPVEVDLTDVNYLSSSGIALLLAVATTARTAGRRLTVVVAEASAPARVLALSGLHGLADPTGRNALTVRATPAS
jgi:anti-anti-sigma factor